jgi:RNA polymerase sigma-70 factor (ECF subfamily)
LEENDQHIDKELFNRLSLGEEEAFRQIVRLYHKRLLPITISLVRSEPVARDIMQEVFLKLWLNRSELAQVDNPGGWLRVVIAHTTSNYIRSQLRYELRNKKLIDSSPDEADNILDQLDARFAQSLINEAIIRLPAKRKQVFLLSRREGLSRQEIARKLDISENTVRNQLSEATAFIQDYLRQKGALIIPAILLLPAAIH